MLSMQFAGQLEHAAPELVTERWPSCWATRCLPTRRSNPRSSRGNTLSATRRIHNDELANLQPGEKAVVRHLGGGHALISR